MNGFTVFAGKEVLTKPVSRTAFVIAKAAVHSVFLGILVVVETLLTCRPRRTARVARGRQGRRRALVGADITPTGCRTRRARRKDL
jgi:hypothetical protein